MTAEFGSDGVEARPVQDCAFAPDVVGGDNQDAVQSDEAHAVVLIPDTGTQCPPVRIAGVVILA